MKVTAGKTVILEPQKYGKRLTYTSSDKTVATVSKKGKVTAKRREMSKSPVFPMVLTGMYQR